MCFFVLFVCFFLILARFLKYTNNVVMIQNQISGTSCQRDFPQRQGLCLNTFTVHLAANTKKKDRGKKSQYISLRHKPINLK